MTIKFYSAIAFVLAKPIIKTAESFSAKPYLCPADKWTIGWGSTRYEDGTPVREGDLNVNVARAEVLLTYAMMRVDKQMQRLITRQPTNHQHAAFLSLCYNIGVGCHDGVKGDFADSDMLHYFNTGNDAGVASEFPLWNKARVKGRLVPLPGLTTRRAVELALYQTPDK